MPESGDRRFRNSGPSATGSSSPPSLNVERLKAFLSGLAANQNSRPNAGGRPKSHFVSERRLCLCCESAMDAVSVEEALLCHRQAVEELTLVIQRVSQSDLGTLRKSELMFELMHHRAIHSSSAEQLDYVMRRNEQLIWRGSPSAD